MGCTRRQSWNEGFVRHQLIVGVDSATLIMEGVLNEMPCADSLVLMSEAIEGLRNKFKKWKESFWGRISNSTMR